MPFDESISAQLEAVVRGGAGGVVRQTRNHIVYEIDPIALTTRNTTNNTTRRIRPPPTGTGAEPWHLRAESAHTLARLRANDGTLPQLDLSGTDGTDGGIDDASATAQNGLLSSRCERCCCGALCSALPSRCSCC